MCGCKKNKVPQTPQEQHSMEMNEWNGGVEIKEEEKKEDEREVGSTETNQQQD